SRSIANRVARMKVARSETNERTRKVEHCVEYLGTRASNDSPKRSRTCPYAREDSTPQQGKPPGRLEGQGVCARPKGRPAQARGETQEPDEAGDERKDYQEPDRLRTAPQGMRRASRRYQGNHKADDLRPQPGGVNASLAGERGHDGG